MKITNELNNKEIELALTGDVNEHWNVFRSLEGDEEFNELFNKVKYGIKEIFDIRSIVEGEYEKKVAFKKVTIERKKDINLTLFRDEIDERIKIMKEVLRSLYNDDFDNQGEEQIDGYQ